MHSIRSLYTLMITLITLKTKNKKEIQLTISVAAGRSN